MAIIKHIKSRNANYSDALEYLLFQHNEKTGKPIFDDSGRKILREEFYMNGLNCDPMSFDKECERTNQFFHKNQKRGDIKSHHYIISFDPADASECGLTGEKAQALCLEYTLENFPGYQALVVTHTDGHNGSGNIHTHIVINSVRKYAVDRQDYMDKPHEQEAGYKHRSTNKLLDHLKQEVMDMCNREGLHQVDLLSPAPAKITKEEYWAKAHGQDKLDKVNEKIRAAGLKPYSRHRSSFCGMRLMNVPSYPEVLMNSSRCFWTGTIFLSSRKEEVIVIFIRTETNESPQNLWVPTMEKTFWNRYFRIMKTGKIFLTKGHTNRRVLQKPIIIQIHLSSFT
mgnify:CR=1 FL=1